MSTRRHGRATLLQPLGGGGGGTVWLAELDDHDGLVVYKRFEASLAVDLDDVVDTALALKGRQLPRVAGIIDGGIVRGSAFVASHFVDGVDAARLSSWSIQQQRPLGTAQATAIALDVLEGLSSLHGAGFVHRDLTPANIVVDRDGRAILVDLDYVCATGTAATSTVPGTLGYLSPEQAQGLPVDGRSDLYAWAIVVTELVLGVSFFAGIDDDEILRRTRTGGHRPSSFVKLPAALRAVLDRCLAGDPADRFVDVAAVRAALAVPPSEPATAHRELGVLVAAALDADVVFADTARQHARLDVGGEIWPADDVSTSVFRPREAEGRKGRAALFVVVTVLVLLALVAALRLANG